MIIKNLRTWEVIELSSDELRQFIIMTSNSTYEDREVKQEHTWRRPTAFRNFFVSDDYKTYTWIYLVTALARINSDKKTRYILFTEYEYPDLVNYVHEDIPIFYIQHEIVYEEVSWLSHRFRENMWNWFSFVDVDFLLANENKVLIIEEKFFKFAKIGYWQMISYKELINDVLINAYRIIIKPSFDDWFFKVAYYDKENNKITYLEQNYNKDQIYELVSDTMNRDSNSNQ